MPTYVYRCRECGHQFEHFEKMSSKRRSRKCPVCGGRGERLISGGAGFLFKGEGFYITDYRSEEYRSKHKAETEKAEPAAAIFRPGVVIESRVDHGYLLRGCEAAHCFRAPKVRPRTRWRWMAMPMITGGTAAISPSAALAP